MNIIYFEVGVCKHQREITKMKQNLKNCHGGYSLESWKKGKLDLMLSKELMLSCSHGSILRIL